MCTCANVQCVYMKNTVIWWGQTSQRSLDSSATVMCYKTMHTRYTSMIHFVRLHVHVHGTLHVYTCIYNVHVCIHVMYMYMFMYTTSSLFLSLSFTNHSRMSSAALRRAAGGPASASCLAERTREKEPATNMASRDSVSPSLDKVLWWYRCTYICVCTCSKYCVLHVAQACLPLVNLLHVHVHV